MAGRLPGTTVPCPAASVSAQRMRTVTDAFEPQWPGGPARQRDRYLAYGLAYAVWLAAAAAGLLPLLYGPAALAGLMELLEANRWVTSAYQRFGFVLLGLGWLVGVLYAEHYLRVSVAKRRLGRAIRRVAAGAALLVLPWLGLLALPVFL